MEDRASSGSWERRPSRNTARWIAWGLAVLCGLAGWEWFVATQNPLWFILLGGLAIWVGLKGGPFTVRTLERVGLFGRVKVDAERLVPGRGAPTVKLDEPFQLGIRFREVTVSHEFRLRDVGVSGSRATRTEKRAVTVLLATVEQDGKTLHLVADEGKPPPFAQVDLRGLSYRRTPIPKIDGRPVRMHLDDLAALLRILHGVEGGSVVTPSDVAEAPGDPRLLFWPAWKRVAGVAVILGLGIAAAVWMLEHAPAVHRMTIEEQIAAEKAALEVEKAQALPLVGQRVVVPGADGTRIHGTARKMTTGATLIDSRTVWRASLVIEVDALRDAEGNPLPEPAAASFAGGKEPARVGGTIEVHVSLVKPEPAAEGN